MPSEENLMILKMLQDGVLSPEQAAELIKAVDTSAANPKVAPVAPVAPVPPVPPLAPIGATPPEPPTPPRAIELDDDGMHSETIARARAKIAAARERVAGVQEQLAAAEEKIAEAEKEPGALEKLEEALKDIPGRRSLSEALRGIDAGRLAASARRQAKRIGKQMKHSIEGINFEVINETFQGDPIVVEPREATYPLAAGSFLRIKNPLGDIDAVGADVPEARVAGTLKIWGNDRAQAEAMAKEIEIVVEESTDGVAIAVQAPSRVRRVSLDLKVFLPQAGGKVSLLSPAGDVSVRNLKGGTVILATQSGDARASEIAGDVVVESGSGEVVLEGILGAVTAKSISGDIQAIRLNGQAFKAETQSGDATLKEANVPSVQLQTVSGDALIENVSGKNLNLKSVSGDAVATSCSFDDTVNLSTTSGSLICSPRGPLALGNLALSTVSGDVTLILPEKTHALLDIKSQSGEVSGAFGEKTFSGKHVSESIGAGAGANISVSSVSGDTTISQE
ncbi:MAG: DUF4097 family beta strand repeat-containing protein [Armatimonas sp.]